MHYDSYSESDEAESAFTDYEFQTPHSKGSCGHELEEENLAVYVDVPASRTQFRLDAYEQTEVIDKKSMQNGFHKLKIIPNKLPSDSESQINQYAEACLSSMKQLMPPLENSGTRNNTAKFYQNSASTEQHFPDDLDGLYAINAEYSIQSGGPTLRRSSPQSNLAKCSSSDGNATIDHQIEEFVNALINPSGRVQSVSCRQLDNDLELEYMQNSNRKDPLESQYLIHENVSRGEHAEGRGENNSISALRMDPDSSVSYEVLSPRCDIKFQADASDFILPGSNGGNDEMLPAKDFMLSVGSIDLEEKDVKGKSETKDADETKVVQMLSTSISWEDKYENDYYTANIIYVPQANNSEEENLRESKIHIPANHLIALDKEATDTNEAVDLFTDGNHTLRAQNGTSVIIQTVCPDSFIPDDQRLYVGRQVQDMDPERTSSSNADMELVSCTMPASPQLRLNCQPVCCSDSDSLKDNQVSSGQCQSHPRSSNMQCTNGHFLTNEISDCNGNEFKIHSSNDGYTLDEEDQGDASTGDLEVDSDEQVNNLGVSERAGDSTGSCRLIIENKICKKTTLNDSEKQIIAAARNSQNEGTKNMEISEKKNAPTEKLSIQDGPCTDNPSIPQFELHAKGRESWQKIPLPVAHGVADEGVSLSSGPCFNDNKRNNKLDTGDFTLSDESIDIHNVRLETSDDNMISEATSCGPTHDCGNCRIRSTSNVNNVQSHHDSHACSNPSDIIEREICAWEGSAVISRGIIEHEEADVRRKKVRYWAN